MPDTLKEEQAVLRLDNVSKNFGGVVAASDICIQLFRGEVFGLIGPNGAGKTTLLNLITGIYMADGGDIYLDGGKITRFATHRRAKMGIARTFQHPRLLNRCDIRTNIFMGVDLAARRRGKNKNLKERFEVSSSPIRDAILRLKEDGIIEEITRSGAKLIDFDPNFACEVNQLIMSMPLDVTEWSLEN